MPVFLCFLPFSSRKIHRWPASGSSLERRDNTPHLPAIRYLGGPNRVSIGTSDLKYTCVCLGKCSGRNTESRIAFDVFDGSVWRDSMSFVGLSICASVVTHPKNIKHIVTSFLSRCLWVKISFIWATNKKQVKDILNVPEEPTTFIFGGYNVISHSFRAWNLHFSWFWGLNVWKSLTHGYPELSHRALRWKLFWDSSRGCYISMGKILGNVVNVQFILEIMHLTEVLIRNVQPPKVPTVVRFVMRCFRNMGPKISGWISGQKMDRDFETKVDLGLRSWELAQIWPEMSEQIATKPVQLPTKRR